MKRIAACLCLFSIVACDKGPAPSLSRQGTISIALLSQVGADQFQLSGSFKISGPQNVVVSTTAGSTATTLTQPLNAGMYTVALQAGYAVTKNGLPVTATLISPQSQAVQVLALSTTNVQFLFTVDSGTVSFGGGVLSIGVSVDETGSYTLPGKIDQLIPTAQDGQFYGTDSTNSKVWWFDLSTLVAASWPTAVPGPACLKPDGTRFYLIEGTGSAIAEYSLPGFTLQREIAWNAPRYDATTHLHILCGATQLFLADGAWGPGLWTVDLTSSTSTVVDHTSKISGIGGFTLTQDGSELYYWYQYGWNAGFAGTDVHRLSTATLAELDASNIGYGGQFFRDPIGTPMLLDETRGLVFAKNRVLMQSKLSTTVAVLSDSRDVQYETSAWENAFAVDPAHGRIATRWNIYSMSDYKNPLAPVTQPGADQYLFAADGTLLMLLRSQGVLATLKIP